MPLNGSCIPAFVGFVVAYYVLAPCCTTTKQRAWILTTISSGITSLAALPYAYDFLATRGQLDMLRPTTEWSNQVVGVFQGYLIADLTLGAIYYPKYVSLLTGWIHHTLYFILLQYVFTVGWTNIFCLALIMEVPTFILASGSINARWRNDYLFATVFFATRIVFHLNLIYGYAKLYLSQPTQSDQTLINNLAASELNSSSVSYTTPSPSPLKNAHTSPLPAIFLLAALPMHILWFKACIEGILRRRAESRKAAGATSVPLFVTSVRTRFQAMRHRLRISREDRDRLRARLGAVYGNARERMIRRGEGVWVRVYEGLRD